jgi:hypothetical protein
MGPNESDERHPGLAGRRGGGGWSAGRVGSDIGRRWSGDAGCDDVGDAGHGTAGLTPAEVALLNSGRSINVLMDPNTGDIESVTPAGGGATVASIRHRDAVCDSDDGC